MLVMIVYGTHTVHAAAGAVETWLVPRIQLQDLAAGAIHYADHANSRNLQVRCCRCLITQQFSGLFTACCNELHTTFPM